MRQYSKASDILHVAKKELSRNKQLYLIVLIPLVFVFIFNYLPMFGVQIAFRDYSMSKGIWKSDFVGFKYFIKFFESYQCKRIIGNTIAISLYALIAGFPLPIILALAMNTCTSKWFRKTVQMATYAPYFISTVVLVSILTKFLSTNYGIINMFLGLFGIEPIMFMGNPKLFRSIYVWSGIWQTVGWNSIIYISTLAGIDPTLHEAAIMDGATRFKRILYVDIPGIKPTMIILLILNFGSIMNIGFEKVFLMQNPMNLETSEIISTYVYKVGLQASIPEYSYATAIGLFNSLINFCLIILVNAIVKKCGETSLW